MNETPEITTDDPRYGFAMVTQAMHEAIAKAAEHPDNQTPCPEFKVADLLDHLVMVMERVAAMGNGEDFASIQQTSQNGKWGEKFKAASAATKDAWMDSAKLEQMFTAPWGETPGGPMLLAYTSELAVHGWDLAQACDFEFTVPDEYLAGALFATKMIPEEGRDTPEIPFGPVTEAGPNASAIEQMAAWSGRTIPGS